MGKGKLLDLEQKLDAALEQQTVIRVDLNQLGAERKELVREKAGLGPIERLEAEHRITAIEVELDTLRAQYKKQSDTVMWLQNRITPMRVRLVEAHRVLNVVENPPPWGLGVSPGKAREIVARAKKTIKELEGV